MLGTLSKDGLLLLRSIVLQVFLHQFKNSKMAATILAAILNSRVKR